MPLSLPMSDRYTTSIGTGKAGGFYAIEKCRYQCTENNFTYSVIYFGCKTDCSAGHSEEFPIKDLRFVSHCSEDVSGNEFRAESLHR